jgi:hypothetical protein
MGRKLIARGMTELSAHSGFSPGHITSAVDRVHFAKDALAQPAVPARRRGLCPAGLRRAGDRVIASIRRGGFVCATYINAKGSTGPGGRRPPASDDKAEPVGPADWLGKWSGVDPTSR